MGRSILLFLFFCAGPALAAAPVSRNLHDAYQAALKRSETMGIQVELLHQADELETQAKAAFFPTVSGSATFLHQPAPGNATGNALYPDWQNLIRISADQPLFRGLRDFAALRQKKAQTGAGELAVTNAARQLFYDTATAFYNVLILEQDQSNYLNELSVNQKRLKELQDFYRIGRSRMTELLTFKSNIASIGSQLEVTRSQLETAKDILAFETGWNRETSLIDDEASVSGPSDVEAYLAHLDERPDVKVAQVNAEAQAEGIPIARGGHLPSLDLLGNYYIERPGALSNVNWDVSLAVSLPIFQGGAIQSQVRQAESVAHQFELAYSQAKRTAEQEIRTFYDAWIGDQRSGAKLDETASLSKLNYEAQLKDYRNGLVTNLDVLQAITTYQDAQRLLDRARLTLKLDAVKLQAASALRPEIGQVK
jgi:outer membrane protein